MEKNVNRLYLVNVLANAQFHLVVYTLFLLSKGFTNRQFFLIESAYYLVSLLLEIPTGVFSDRKSRKWSLVIASVIGLVITPIVILSDSFILVLIAMAVGGVSSALVSGTDTAMLYDTLKALDRAHDFKRITLVHKRHRVPVLRRDAEPFRHAHARNPPRFIWRKLHGIGVVAGKVAHNQRLP